VVTDSQILLVAGSVATVRVLEDALTQRAYQAWASPPSRASPSRSRSWTRGIHGPGGILSASDSINKTEGARLLLIRGRVLVVPW